MSAAIQKRDTPTHVVTLAFAGANLPVAHRGAGKPRDVAGATTPSLDDSSIQRAMSDTAEMGHEVGGRISDAVRSVPVGQLC